MAYPFVAAPDNWPRGGAPVKAIVIHHAEGGGTVSWLTRDDGNSSHYVVEYTGRVVQMVREDRAAGSINPKLTRTDDDPSFTFENESITYGVTANKAALGDHWRNANAAVIAIEVEGFAKDGPNNVQRKALGNLVADIRTRHPGIPALGHRDFQSYKACPGHKIPWADYGGHGSKPDTAGADVSAIKATAKGTVYAYIVRIPEKAVTYGPNEGERGEIGPWVGNGLGIYGLDEVSGRPVYLVTDDGKAVYVAVADTAITTTKWERTVTDPIPAEAHVVTLTVDGQTKYSETLP